MQDTPDWMDMTPKATEGAFVGNQMVLETVKKETERGWEEWGGWDGPM